MSSIKQILDQFCYRMNIPPPASYVNNNTPAARQYVSLFKFIGDNLRNRPYQWPQLKRGYYFNTVNGQSRYQLPGDFYRLLDSSQWDTTNQWPMRGPISDLQWAIREFAVVSLQTRKGYRLIGPTDYLFTNTPYAQRSRGWFEITPAGDDTVDELFLGYISSNWIWPFDWIATTAYGLGDTISGDGYMYICTTAGTSGTTRPSVSTGTEVDGTVTWTVYIGPYELGGATTLSDNDRCLFDEDVMIEGMRWAYLRAKGQDYQHERVDWENELKSAFARFNGPVRVNLADSNDDYPGDWPITPQGSWSV